MSAVTQDLMKLYSQRILALAASIPQIGRLEDPQGSAMKRSPLCGSTVTVDVRVENDRISDFRQDVKACALGQSSASVLGANAIGRSREEIAEAREALQLEMTDATMKALAAAMKPSDMMKQAAKAIESEEYDEASEKLKAIDPSKIGDKQRRAVADNLKKMMTKLKPGQQGELSECIGQLAEGLESKNKSECKKCLSKLASQCEKQGNCKKIGNCMSCQLNRLAQCKSQCRGQCNGNKVAKSNSPSTKAGKGASGQALGDKATELASTRKEEHLSGVQGEGPSETEIMQAPEGEQEAVRQFAKKYNKFKREAESVLDSEPLPMGHRETVRAYFEAIRPTNETPTE